MSLTPRVFAYTLSGAELQTAARNAIENALAAQGENRRHEIIFTQKTFDVNLPEGIIDVSAQMPSQLSYISLNPVRLIVSVNGRMARTVSVTAKVNVYDTVLIANHDLRIEGIVNAGDFRLAEIAIDGRGDYITDVDKVIGLVPHRFIRAGSPISLTYFRQPVVVNSGQLVNIVANINGVKATAKGIVMSRGRIGDLVKVKNEITKRILTAKVIDAQTVEISFAK